ncbi:MAG: hypothetical protein WCI22_06560 [Actinomycetota bacterium]
MESTTIKLSVHTRDRLRAFGGATYEDTVVEALDALESIRFWAQADAAAGVRQGRSMAHRDAAQHQIEAIDTAFDGIE